MMNVVFGRATDLSWPFTALMEVVELLTSPLFLVLQERTMQWLYRFLQRAAELEQEQELGFRQYPQRPKGHKLTDRVAMWLFFIVIIRF